MGYFDWHEQPGYWRDVTRHFAPDTRLLDVGCGSGLARRALRRLHGRRRLPGGGRGRGRARPHACCSATSTSRCRSTTRASTASCSRTCSSTSSDPVPSCARCGACCAPGGRVFASSPDAQRWVWDDYTHRRPFTRKAFRLLFADQGFDGRARRLRVGDARHRRSSPRWTRAGTGALRCSSALPGCRWCAATSGCSRSAALAPAPAGGLPRAGRSLGRSRPSGSGRRPPARRRASLATRARSGTSVRWRTSPQPTTSASIASARGARRGSAGRRSAGAGSRGRSPPARAATASRRRRWRRRGARRARRAPRPPASRRARSRSPRSTSSP